VTYSRPQTSTVNAFSTPARQNEPVAAPRQVVSTTPNGSLRVLDLGNGDASASTQLKGFFDQILTVAPKMVESYDIAKSTRQAGDLLANVDISGVVKSGDEASLGMIKRLSPRAQDMVWQGASLIASQNYVESTARNAAIEPLLLNGKSDSETEAQFTERFAKGRANVRTKALSESGMGNLPPEYRAEGALKAQQGESLVYNQIRKGHDEQYSQEWDAMQSNRYATESLGYYRARNLIISAPDPGLRRDEIIALNQQGQKFYESIKDIAKPTRAAQIAFSGIKQTYQQLVTEERYAEAANYLDYQGIVANQKIDTIAGGNLWDIPVTKDGSSIKTAIAQLSAGLQPQIERARAKENFLSIKDLLPGLTRREPEAMREAQTRLFNASQTPEEFSSMYGTIKQALALGEPLPPTQAEKEIMLGYQAQQLRLGADLKKINAQILGDHRLSIDSQSALLKPERPGANPIMESTSRAREYNSPQIQDASMTLYQAAIEKDPSLAKDSATAQETARKLSSGLIVTATQNTEVRLRRLESAGKPVGADVANEIFRNELDAVKAVKLKELGGTAPVTRQTVAQERLSDLNYIKYQIQKNGGKVTPSVFPSGVIEDARKNGVNVNDSRKLTQFFLKRMDGTMEGGKKFFTNPGDVWRQMYNSAQPAQSSSGPGMPTLPIQQLGTTIMRFVGGGDKAPAAQPGKKGDTSSQPTSIPQMAARLGEGLLGGALNVVAPPAMAAQGPSRLQNPDQMPRLGLAFRNANSQNPQPMSLHEGPLPQIVASAPVRPLPLAITTDMHPWFVAIGINEGTRTANGGYTKNYFGHIDPKDKNRNVGTVSGGGVRGGGGSPQVVDRIWAGKLTKQAMVAASLLMARGFNQGTLGFQRVMFNYLDLHVQSPAAAGTFIQKLSQMMKGGLTIEAIAKARADSYYYPDGRWGGAWPYPRLLQDQRSRAGTFDYKKRL